MTISPTINDVAQAYELVIETIVDDTVFFIDRMQIEVLAQVIEETDEED